ncbi:hypothetical protein [Lactobacillus phage Semele]|uniref:Uncharacterized protein n=1 Tax=Lactobacillus phage Semele TaxID=2079433 RepID=A0A2K9VD73_9CAUD|nr:hypothetical protein HOS80_gp129 [Lactobacillus phage Semele]AUV60155.1 hypothetical protein [Lactobacillus phage Semele]
MTFSEAVQAMLSGEKIARVNSRGHGYIMIDDDDDGNVVDGEGAMYRFSKNDFVGGWKIVNIPAIGSLLKKYGKYYRLIRDTDGTYAILDASTYVEEIRGITEENLIRDLTHYGFDIG